jgi:hypothetical protein
MAQASVSLSIQASVSPETARKISGLISDSGLLPVPLSGQYGRATLVLILREAEIRAIRLADHPSPPSASGQTAESASSPQGVHDWTFDNSRSSFIGWADGLSIEIPPATPPTPDKDTEAAILAGAGLLASEVRDGVDVRQLATEVFEAMLGAHSQPLSAFPSLSR